jgi:hypothetical protein
LIEICHGETGDDDIVDTYEIVVMLSEGKDKTLNTNKNFQLLDVSIDLKKLTTKDKTAIKYFPGQIIINKNSSLFNDMISKKEECLSKTVNQDDFNDIEFVMRFIFG